MLVSHRKRKVGFGGDLDPLEPEARACIAYFVS